MKILKTIDDKEIIGKSSDYSKKYSLRIAARAIVFNSKNKIAIVHSTKHHFHKLPGGGVEKEENIKNTLKRELAEEIGCSVKIIKKLGIIIELKNKYGQKQISHCYIAKISEKFKSSPTKEEKEELGIEVKYVNLKKAIKLLEKDNPLDYTAKFIKVRDLIFLKEILKNKITITGPRSVGKTTISKLLSEKINLNCISSDEIGEKALKKEGGLDKAIKSGKIRKIIQKKGYSLIEKQYEKINFVLDLSGGAFTSEKYFNASKKVRKVSKENSILIGLLPSKNNNKSLKFLFEREKERMHFKDMSEKKLISKIEKDYIIFEPLFEEFCDFVFYVDGKNPDEITNEILQFLEK